MSYNETLNKIIKSNFTPTSVYERPFDFKVQLEDDDHFSMKEEDQVSNNFSLKEAMSMGKTSEDKSSFLVPRIRSSPSFRMSTHGGNSVYNQKDFISISDLDTIQKSIKYQVILDGK